MAGYSGTPLPQKLGLKPNLRFGLVAAPSGFVRTLGALPDGVRAQSLGRGANRFDGPGEVLFVARVAGHAVGVCGLNVDPYAGDSGVGRVRHLYVLAAQRRAGIGRRLVAEIIAAARGRFGRLRLRTQNPEAARLYEQLGFRRSPGERDCTHVMDLVG